MDLSQLNKDQQDACLKILDGKNVLLTGYAGTGKSFILKKIVDYFKERKTVIGITATTGISAIGINGRTIHSLLGLGLGTKTANELFIYNRKRNPKLIKYIKNLRVLIIDEISMLDDRLFEKISEYLCLIRNSFSGEVFGGIQLILCGDFCQLPPVSGDYCFKSTIWSISNIEIVQLTIPMRQSEDAEFFEILNAVRWGNCSPEILMRLKALKDTEYLDGIEPTVLHSKNIDVDFINVNKLEELVDGGAEIVKYELKTSRNTLAKTWAESLKIPEVLDLCIGVQVMLSVNLSIERGLVNGSRGVVVKLDKTIVEVKFQNGLTEPITYFQKEDEDIKDLWISYIPLKLAYAISIHKSQSMTLDAVEMDLGLSIFSEGQAYTALSRARNLKSIRMKGISSKSFKSSLVVRDFYTKHGLL